MLDRAMHLVRLVTLPVVAILAIAVAQPAVAAPAATHPVRACSILSPREMRVLIGAPTGAKITVSAGREVAQKIDYCVFWETRNFNVEGDVTLQRGKQGLHAWDRARSTGKPLRGGPPGARWSRPTGTLGFGRWNRIYVQVATSQALAPRRVSRDLWVAYKDVITG